MKVLVTGAGGFVGRHLVEHLVRDGRSVRALVSGSSDSSGWQRLGVEVVEGDIRDERAMADAVAGCEQLYHLAGRVTRHKAALPESVDVNVRGTVTLARAALAAGVGRIVFGGTVGVHGVVRDPPASEETPPEPNTPYRESKWLAEQALNALHAAEGLPVVIARLGGVVGAGSRSWVPLVRAVSAGGFRMIGSGKNRVSVTAVADAVDGLRRCGDTEGIEGRTYLIVDDRPITLERFVSMIAAAAGVRVAAMHLPVAPYRAYRFLGAALERAFRVRMPRVHEYEIFLADRAFDTRRARRELGYDPGASIEEAIRELVEWCRAGASIR